jgi:DNA-binding transcriptional LysR family regulator
MAAMIEARCARGKQPCDVKRPPRVVPELRHLRAFLAVAQELNFTRAAERLNLAQQAVSKSVAQLEGELGVELLERTSREVRLTDAGRRLLGDARDVVAGADAAFARARDHGRGLAGSLSVGATPPVGPTVLRDVARRMREDAPGLSIALREVRPPEVESALRDRLADVVLTRTVRTGPGFAVTELAPTPAALLVPADHRLAEADSVGLCDVDGERLLTWSAPGTPYTDLLVGLCAGAGARVTPVETSVTGVGEIVELAPLGAVAIVPEGWPAGTDARLVALDGGIGLPLLAVTPAGGATPAVRRLLDAFGSLR